MPSAFHCNPQEARHGSIAEAIQEAADGTCPLLILYPAPGSTRLDSALLAASLQSTSLEDPPASLDHPTPTKPRPKYTLLAIDGTWQQAREMWAASCAALAPPGTIVHLPPEAAQSARTRLMMEPGEGCTTTCQAVAEALRLLEGTADPADAVLCALEALSEQQAQWDPAVRERRAAGAGLYAPSKRAFGAGKSVLKSAAGLSA